MKRTTIAALTRTTVAATTGAWPLLHRGSKAPAITLTTSLAVSTDTASVSAPTTRPTTVTNTNERGHPKAGAVHAAVRFLKLDEQLLPAASPETARTMSDAIPSPGARQRLGDRTEAHKREILAKGNLQGLTLRIAPISTRVRGYSTGAATVDIFLLRLWSYPTSRTEPSSNHR